MKNEIREIGLERELFLLDNQKNVKEPKQFGFPRDEFEFLVEIRSLPSDRLYPVYTTMQQEELQYKLRANKFNMMLSNDPFIYAERTWVEALWKKYNLNRFKDYTQNIYGKKDETHHKGVLQVEKNLCKLTAGVHVHFSSRNKKTGEVIKLPIEDIVRQMDKKFKEEVILSERILGEWELKTHGFEYRSLPANIDIYKVLKESFRILREV